MSKFFNSDAEFTFKSKLSRFLRTAFIERDLTMKDVAEHLDWEVSKVSSYYNDKKVLSNEDAEKLSEFLGSIGVKCDWLELCSMQRTAEYILYSDLQHMFETIKRAK